MIRTLIHSGEITKNQVRAMTPRQVLNLYEKNSTCPIEYVVVESGQLAIFDGIRFAHDASKGELEPLREGKFVPSMEPDCLMVLDQLDGPYNREICFPQRSFLEDPGRDYYWRIMGKNHPEDGNLIS